MVSSAGDFWLAGEWLGSTRDFLPEVGDFVTAACDFRERDGDLDGVLVPLGGAGLCKNEHRQFLSNRFSIHLTDEII